METSRFHRVVLTLLNPKVGIPLALFLLALAGPFIYRSLQLAGIPDIGDPFDVEEFVNMEVADEENAFVEYRAATAILVPSSKVTYEQMGVAWEKGWPAASEAVKKWVNDNRPAMETWRQGTQKPDALYHQPRRVSLYSSSMEIIGGLREFTLLARLEGSRLESEGDYQGAWECYRAAFRSSRHIGKRGFLIDRLSGAGIHQVVVRNILRWSRDPRVDAGMLRQALGQLQTDFRMTPPISTAIKFDYLVIKNTLNRADLYDFSAGFGLSAAGEQFEVFFKNEPELSQRIAQHVFANWLSQIDLPRHAQTARHSGVLDLFEPDPTVAPAATSLTPNEIERHLLRSYFAKVFLSPLMQVEVAFGREQARQAALVVALAAQLYDREHGRFPENAEDLLDGYLKDLPADPFGKAGETIHYRREQDGFVVWSIGSDKTDDGGDVSFDESKPAGPPDIGFEVKRPVAEGLNRKSGGSKGVPSTP